MKGKGFTLIELLAVLVILAVILAIAVPGIIGIVENASKMAFESDAKLVLKGIDYKKLTNDGFDPTTINNGNINQLLGISNQNYSSVAIALDENDKPIINIIGTNKWGGFIACGTYRDMKVVESPIDCDVDLMTPVITVLGSNPASVYAGDAYTDAGATALDYNDGDITSDIVVTGSVNTSVVDEYTITYTVTDSDGNIGTASRTVYVLDHSAPVITMNGSNPVDINIGSTYNDAGATALDDIDGDITSKITVSSDVNPNVMGTYTVTYNVTDKAGNIAAPVTRTVNVVDRNAPTIPTSGVMDSLAGSNPTGVIGAASGSIDNESSVIYLYLITNNSSIPDKNDSRFTTNREYNRTCGTNYYGWAVAEDESGNHSEVYAYGHTQDGDNVYSSWSTCSVTCGGGIQTRTSSCALITTGLSQSCNTQACCTPPSGACSTVGAVSCGRVCTSGIAAVPTETVRGYLGSTHTFGPCSDQGVGQIFYGSGKDYSMGWLDGLASSFSLCSNCGDYYTKYVCTSGNFWQ